MSRRPLETGLSQHRSRFSYDVGRERRVSYLRRSKHRMSLFVVVHASFPVVVHQKSALVLERHVLACSCTWRTGAGGTGVELQRRRFSPTTIGHLNAVTIVRIETPSGRRQPPDGTSL